MKTPTDFHACILMHSIREVVDRIQRADPADLMDVRSWIRDGSGLCVEHEPGHIILLSGALLDAIDAELESRTPRQG